MTYRKCAALSAVLAILTLTACGGGGGGGGATAALSMPSVAIKLISVSGVNIEGLVASPTDKVVVSYSAGSAGDVQGVGNLTTLCGTQQLAATQETASTSSLAFGHSDWVEGSCTGTVTVSAAGYASATQTFAYTVKKPVVAPFDYKVVIYSDKATFGVVEADTSTPSGYKVTPFTISKTGYTSVALCAVAMQGDGAWIASDGYPRFSCVTRTAGNLRRLFVSKQKGELTVEDLSTVLPMGVQLRDVRWVEGVSPYPTQVTGHGDYLKVGNDILYLTATGWTKLEVTRDGFVSSLDLGVDFAQFITTVKSQN